MYEICTAAANIRLDERKRRQLRRLNVRLERKRQRLGKRKQSSLNSSSFCCKSHRYQLGRRRMRRRGFDNSRFNGKKLSRLIKLKALVARVMKKGNEGRKEEANLQQNENDTTNLQQNEGKQHAFAIANITGEKKCRGCGTKSKDQFTASQWSKGTVHNRLNIICKSCQSKAFKERCGRV